jgi:hypothetical protein
MTTYLFLTSHFNFKRRTLKKSTVLHTHPLPLGFVLPSTHRPSAHIHRATAALLNQVARNSNKSHEKLSAPHSCMYTFHAACAHLPSLTRLSSSLAPVRSLVGTSQTIERAGAKEKEKGAKII